MGKSKQPNQEQPAVDVYSKEMVNEATRRDKLIKDRLSKGDNSLLDVAFQLEWFKANQTYRTFGYKSFAELADKRYGVKKTTAYEYIEVIERFGHADKGNSISALSESYRPYNISQLIAMQPLDDIEIMVYIKPDMSVRDIKKKVKQCIASKAPPDAAAPEDNVKPSPAPKASEGSCEKQLNTEQLNIVKILTLDNLMELLNLKNSDTEFNKFFKKLEAETKKAFKAGAENITINITWERENPKEPGKEGKE